MSFRPGANQYLILTILCWSTVATAFKLVLRTLPVADLLLIATVTSTILLWSLLLILGKGALVLQQSRRQLLLSAFQGVLNPVLYYLVLFEAYRLLPAQLAQPLNFTWPLMLMLLSILFLKQRLTGRKLMALLISYGGVVLVVTRGNFSLLMVEDPGGVLLALVSTVFWALYWLLNLRDKRDDLLKLTMAFSWGALYLIIALPWRAPIQFPSFGVLGGAIYIGVFEMGLTFFFWLRALKLARNQALPLNVIYLTPFVSLIWINFLLGEQVHHTAIIGLLLIAGGILLQRSLPGQNRLQKSRES